MSLESAKEFIERIKTDEKFAEQVASRKNKEERMKFVLEQGYSFSEQEIAQLKQELTEEELGSVAAGWDCRFDQLCGNIRGVVVEL